MSLTNSNKRTPLASNGSSRDRDEKKLVKSMVNDTQFVSVNTTSDGKVDTAVITDLVPYVSRETVRSLLSNRVIGGKGNSKSHRSPQTRVKLFWKITNSSSAGAALTSVISIAPSLSGEFSAFTALYDECKVDGGKIRYTIESIGTIVDTQTWCCLTYDPVNAGVYGSVASAMAASQMKLTAIRSPTSVALVSPDAVDAAGYWTFPFRVPTGAPARSATSGSLLYSGEWADTLDTSVFGYVKPYVEALGGAAVITMSAFVEVDIHFRCRT